MLRFIVRDVLWLTVVVALSVAWWMDHRSNSATTERLRTISHDLANKMNGRDDIEVRVVNDHLYFRTGASQNPPPQWWPKP